MDSHMNYHIRPLRKLLAAYHALKLFHIHVNTQHMIFEVFFSGKFLATRDALKNFTKLVTGGGMTELSNTRGTPFITHYAFTRLSLCIRFRPFDL